MEAGQVKRTITLRGVVVSSIAAASLVLLVLPGTASAAIQLGQVAPADPGSAGCSGSNWVQTSTSTVPYVVPSPGVITMWSHRGDDESAGSGRLQAWTITDGTFFTLVGRSELQAFTAGSVRSYPTRIEVRAGDLLGMRAEGDAGCFYSTGGGNGTRSASGFDPVPGDTVILSDAGSTILLNVAAILEQDADRDGFGDETQDGCPGQAGPESGCPPGTAPPPGDGGDGDGGDANDFSFGKVKKNKRRGTAKLTVNIPGGGELELAKTKKVKADDESAEDAGKEKLSIKPRGKAKKKLNTKGKAKVKAEVTFTLGGGSPNTEDKKIKLVKR
jgi:hypothetical protein